jgi:hypothetical protein
MGDPINLDQDTLRSSASPNAGYSRVVFTVGWLHDRLAATEPKLPWRWKSIPSDEGDSASGYASTKCYNFLIAYSYGFIEDHFHAGRGVG